MARAALEWSLEDAAAAVGVSRRTVLRFERYHRDVKPELIGALRRAYEEAGCDSSTGAPTSAKRCRRRCLLHGIAVRSTTGSRPRSNSRADSTFTAEKLGCAAAAEF
jgi:transcriptional regulator with XRE-family HTH domain